MFGRLWGNKIVIACTFVSYLQLLVFIGLFWSHTWNIWNVLYLWIKFTYFVFSQWFLRWWDVPAKYDKVYNWGYVYHWLILTTCQPMPGDFLPRVLGIAFIVHSYLQFFVLFLKSLFCTQLYETKYSYRIQIICT